MPDVPPFELLDLVLIALILVGVLSGVRQGGISQALGLVGAALGGVAAVLLLPELANVLPPMDRVLRAVIVLTFVLGALAVGQALGSMAAFAVVQRLGRGPLRTADRAFGGIVGGGQVILLVWFLAPLLAVGPTPYLADQVDHSAVVGVLHDALPAPGPVVGRLRALLDPMGLPQVFEFFEMPGGTPVATTPPGVAAQIGRRATPSTVAVVGEACGMRVTGTGFAVAPGYFVTNAHVVAGERRPRVGDDRDSASATIVVYDPALDVALLYAPGLSTPALSLDTTLPQRGDQGAALGHPNGGDLAIVPAAVQDVFTATGYDIYGQNTITRTVIELAADVQAGDSGGPYVGADGKVDGVVFARSRTGSGIGYALTMPSVQEAIMPGLGSTAAVSTGACLP